MLVVREVSLRWKSGWSGILLLGAAYGIVEEGLAVTTFFNPTLPQVASGSLGWYGRAFGVNWVWAAWLTIFHAIVRIAIPIFLIEWHYPALRGRRLLSDRGFGVTLALLAAVTIAIDALVAAAVSYRVGLAEYVGALLVIALLAYAARRGLGRVWLRLPTGRPLPRWSYAAGGAGFFALSFLVYSGGPVLGGAPAITYLEGGILLLLALLLVRRTVGAPDAIRAQFAFVAGAVGFFATFAIILGVSGNPAFLGMPLVGLGFLAYIVWLARAKGPIRAQTSGPVPVP